MFLNDYECFWMLLNAFEICSKKFRTTSLIYVRRCDLIWLVYNVIKRIFPLFQNSHTFFCFAGHTADFSGLSLTFNVTELTGMKILQRWQAYNQFSNNWYAQSSIDMSDDCLICAKTKTIDFKQTQWNCSRSLTSKIKGSSTGVKLTSLSLQKWRIQ